MTRPKIAALSAVALGLTWLAYSPCYCWLEPEDTAEHLRQLPPGCAVLDVPSPWFRPDGSAIKYFSRTRDLFYEQEFRISAAEAGVVLIALTSYRDVDGDDVRGATTTNKFKFRYAALQEGHEISDLVPATQPEWAAAMPLKFEKARPGDRRNRGKFPITDRYQYWSEPVFSSEERWIEVPSYGRSEVHGNAAADFELTRPWRTFEAAIYDVSRGTLARRIRGWSCQLDKLQYAQFHGDSLFSVPLSNDSRKILTCGM